MPLSSDTLASGTLISGGVQRGQSPFWALRMTAIDTPQLPSYTGVIHLFINS